MELTQAWLGALVLAVGVVVAGLTWWWRHGNPTSGRVVPAAALDRVRRLPAFRALARAEARSRGVEAACLALAVAGSALLAARLVGVSDDARELHTRDVVLCLDVSGSMSALDDDVLEAYLQLAATLEGERIGFVMFDAQAVTGFPLTADHDYILTELSAARERIADGDVPGTRSARSGSSLIGDGLATCVQHFDHATQERSRTVVLATDNLVSGDSIYTVRQAGRLASERGAMVFGVMPAASEPAPVRELREVTRSTHGEVLLLEQGEPTNVAVIAAAVRRQEKVALLATAQDRSFDLVWPGGVLVLLGLAGALAASWRRP